MSAEVAPKRAGGQSGSTAHLVIHEPTNQRAPGSASRLSDYGKLEGPTRRRPISILIQKLVTATAPPCGPLENVPSCAVLGCGKRRVLWDVMSIGEFEKRGPKLRSHVAFLQRQTR